MDKQTLYTEKEKPNRLAFIFKVVKFQNYLPKIEFLANFTKGKFWSPRSLSTTSWNLNKNPVPSLRYSHNRNNYITNNYIQLVNQLISNKNKKTAGGMLRVCITSWFHFSPVESKIVRICPIFIPIFWHVFYTTFFHLLPTSNQ